MAYKLVVYKELCHGCGNCVVACPVNASKSTEIAGGKGPQEDVGQILIVEDGTIELKDLSECNNCATCIKACPVNAIALEEI